VGHLGVLEIPSLIVYCVRGVAMIARIGRIPFGFIALPTVQGSFDCGCSLRFARRTILAQDDNAVESEVKLPA
jgi:hypothetical protein